MMPIFLNSIVHSLHAPRACHVVFVCPCCVTMQPRTPSGIPPNVRPYFGSLTCLLVFPVLWKRALRVVGSRGDRGYFSLTIITFMQRSYILGNNIPCLSLCFVFICSSPSQDYRSPLSVGGLNAPSSDFFPHSTPISPLFLSHPTHIPLDRVVGLFR